MSYSERLDEAMRAVTVDRKALANHLHISVQAVGQVLTGKTKALDAANHVKAALFLKCDPLWLATGDGLRVPKRSPADWPFARITPQRWLTLDPVLQDKIETFAEGVLIAASQDDRGGAQTTGTHG
jgi:hypothetical protein